MGAWGPGLQASDDAQDAISEALEHGVRAGFEWARANDGDAGSWHATVGLAEWAMEQGYPSKRMPHKLVSRAIREERAAVKEQGWKIPKERHEALEIFERRWERWIKVSMRGLDLTDAEEKAEERDGQRAGELNAELAERVSALLDSDDEGG